MRRKQKEDAEETATKKSRVVSYLDEDDGKEVEQDVNKEERKRKERLVILTLVQLFHLNLTDLVASLLC